MIPVMRTAPALLALLLGALLTACEAPEEGPRAGSSGPATVPAAPSALPPSPAPAPSYDPALATATLRVLARFEGEPPKMRAIKFDADPACAAMHEGPVLEETVVVRGGMLANVVVFVSAGTERWTFPPAEDPVLLEMRGCLFVPHVLTLRTGQPLRIRNSDSVVHCAHGLPRVNREFNLSMPLNGKVRDLAFALQETGFRVQCDRCGWMIAWISVFDHPFHGVTDREGVAGLPLPPGEYEVSVWHEKLKAPVARKVVVAEGETAGLEFTFGVK